VVPDALPHAGPVPVSFGIPGLVLAPHEGHDRGEFGLQRDHRETIAQGEDRNGLNGFLPLDGLKKSFK
jgi:hypothetical protein